MGTNHRARSRGRSSARRKLPPIPERSLSSQRVGRSGDGESNITSGDHIKKTKIRGGTTPPSPESRSPVRRYGSNRTPEHQMVTDVESRDDDEASAVVPTEVVVPLSSPEACTAVSSPVRHSSKCLINLPVNGSSKTLVHSNKDGNMNKNGTASPIKNEDVTEQWWKEYQRSHSDVADIAADGCANDYPEITSIPTDEILDSSNRKPSPIVPDEDSVSRDERDQYQLERLKARIDQRAERSRDYIDEDDDSLNYKSLRSSRIKNVRSLYSPNTKNQSGETSIHGSTNSSTIPSIKHGQTINSSTVSSAELSEYREKIFSKMLHMLNDLSPNSDNTFQDDTLSHIRDTVIDESRASCGSVEEFNLIQRLTEETMSRILHEFEQNNSLVECEDPNVDDEEIPEDFANEHKSPIMETQTETETRVDHEFPPHVFRDIGTMSITSKLSDVTSPTIITHGFEIDEISPVSHCRSMSSLANYHGEKKLHPMLSPAAAAAAEMAASNGTLQSLPCVMEVPETIELSNEDSDSRTNIEKDKQPLHLNVEAKTHSCDDKLTKKGIQESTNALELIVKEAEVLDESEKGTTLDLPGDEEYEDNRRVASQEDHFHDEILSAVLKAATTAKRLDQEVEDAAFIAAQPLAEDYDNDDDTNELMEVTSILSKYEETEGARKAKEKVEPKVHSKMAETSKQAKSDGDDISVLPFDEKKVRFLEDQNQATCGACAIQ